MKITRKKKATAKKAGSFYGGQRKIVHLRLPESVKQGMREGSELKDKFKMQLWDEACKRFLKKANLPGSVIYEHPAKGVPYVTIWIAIPLIDELQEIAKRDSVALARVVHTAGAQFVRANKK